MPTRYQVRFTDGEIPEGFIEITDPVLIERARRGFAVLEIEAENRSIKEQDLIVAELAYGPEAGNTLVARRVPFPGAGPVTCVIL